MCRSFGLTASTLASLRLLLSGLFLLAATAGAARAAPASSSTTTYHNLVESYPVPGIPCTDSVSATIYLTINAVVHETDLSSGGSHFLIQNAGDFVLVPDEAGIPTYAGHIASLQVEANTNMQSATAAATGSFIAQGSDGSILRFQLGFHEVITPTGLDIGLSRLVCNR
jgi:hypothetical protein